MSDFRSLRSRLLFRLGNTECVANARVQLNMLSPWSVSLWAVRSCPVKSTERVARLQTALCVGCSLVAPFQYEIASLRLIRFLLHEQLSFAQVVITRVLYSVSIQGRSEKILRKYRWGVVRLVWMCRDLTPIAMFYIFSFGTSRNFRNLRISLKLWRDGLVQSLLFVSATIVTDVGSRSQLTSFVGRRFGNEPAFQKLDDGKMLRKVPSVSVTMVVGIIISKVFYIDLSAMWLNDTRKLLPRRSLGRHLSFRRPFLGWSA